MLVPCSVSAVRRDALIVQVSPVAPLFHSCNIWAFSNLVGLEVPLRIAPIKLRPVLRATFFQRTARAKGGHDLLLLGRHQLAFKLSILF